MANIDKGNNRYTNAASKEDKINEIDNNKVVLKILKDEFPDDILYSRDQLTQESPTRQAFNSFTTEEARRLSKKLVPAKRNTKNVLDLTTEKDEYSEYELSKSYPTIDEDALDDLIDEEWEYFEDPDEEDIVVVEAPKPSGLFLVNSETDLDDFHDLYISAGPHTIDAEDEDVASRVFCVFFVRNGTAYAIPTYKTLEVMLVERGLTYDAISEATAEEIKDFDLLIDGNVDDDVDYDDVEMDEDGDGDISPLEEFRARSMPVRDSDWNASIRYRSGYRPKTPFLRDPGDYIKPESMRAFEGRSPVDEDGNELEPDIYYDQDPDDRYFDQVFQKQTYREKLREKFEGKMIVGDWPAPEYDQEDVTQGTFISSDDAVLNLRMMINGHWKFVRDGAVMKLYAYLNDYDIADYAPGDAGRYGATGYIQLLIEAGGCTVVQAAGGKDGQNDALAGNSDMSLSNKAEPLWNAFPHIVDADDDGEKGVDREEYQEYLDNFTNGGDPFGIEYLQPYEPAGSIAYYPAAQYDSLVQQAIEQEQIDAIKEQIYEIWPGIASTIESTKTQFDSLPADYGNYVVKRLGANSPLYKIMISKSGNWKYIKKKTWFGKDKLKTKYQSKLLFKVCNKRIGIKTSFNEKQERDIVKKYKWMRTVKRDKFASWMNSTGGKVGAGSAVATGAGVAISSAISAATVTTTTLVPAITGFTTTVLPGILGSVSLTTPVFGSVAMTTTVGPTFGTTIGALVTNPITIGAAAVVGAFFLADALIGKVPNDKHDLPPWRFMDDNWYLKSCILNQIDGHVEGFKQAADAADAALPWVNDIIQDLSSKMGEMDQALLSADSAEEFQALYEFLLNIRDLCKELNDSGLYAQGVNLTNEVDAYLRDQLKRQYNAVQYMRKKIYNSAGLFKGKRKYGVVWPKGAQQILNEYVAGCKFDNHLPKV